MSKGGEKPEDKNANDLPNSSRRAAISKIGILFGGLLVAGSAIAEDTREKGSEVFSNPNTSRVAQELNRSPELIGQAEMERLVNCHNIISAHFINPIFLDLISMYKWHGEALQALYLAIQNPYDLSYEYDDDGRNIIVSKRTPGAESPIADGFEIKIHMSPGGKIGCITQIIDETINEEDETGLQKMRIVRSRKTNMEWMDKKAIARSVSHHKNVINAELRTGVPEEEAPMSLEDKMNLPEPLKPMFILLNKTIPKHIALVMRARGFSEVANNNSRGSYEDFSQLEKLQRTSLTSYQDFIDQDENWLLEVDVPTNQSGFYRILLQADNNEDDEFNTVDFSLDGYILYADEDTGEVVPNSREDGRQWQLDPMYYPTNSPDGNPEHLLKSRYYRGSGGARGKK